MFLQLEVSQFFTKILFQLFVQFVQILKNFVVIIFLIIFKKFVLKSLENFLNPPEAIRNLATPVATPRSVRPGFFNPSGHTMVCQTGVFF